MQTVPDPIIVEILSYLPISEIIRAESICKKIKSCLEAHSYVLYFRIAENINKESISYNHWKGIVKQMIGSSKELQFIPYYTDGGVYRGNKRYYLQNLMVRGFCYCAVRPTNVLVKYVLAGINYDIDKIEKLGYVLSGWHENSDNIYLESDVLREAKEFTLKTPIYAVVKQILVKVPDIRNYTCPIHHLICFSSLEEISDLGIIEKFHDATTLEKAKEISNQLGLSYEEEQGIFETKIAFNNCNLSVQPLCWIELHDGSDDFVTFDLKARKLARYFYALLIDAKRTNLSDNNLDAYIIMPKGSVINF